MSFPRRVLPELLDELPAEDPRAVRSRGDLRRVNRLMGTHSILLRALDSIAPTAVQMRLVEFGAGDGTMMLRLARSRSHTWPGAKVALLDRQPVVSVDTLAAIRDLGWEVEVITADVFAWLAQPSSDGENVVFANLFVHHFDGERLLRLLGRLAERSRAFICCEPRRSGLALAGSHLLGLIGCNEITRHDAVLSVHAGFRDKELSSLWPNDGLWERDESAAGLFSHLFVANRVAR